jgi:hypothetical protein
VPKRAHTLTADPGSADVRGMKNIQIIELDGLPAALVVGDEAIIAERVSGADRVRAQAKALHAIAIRSGTRPGPYTDEGAEHYAASLASHRLRRSLLVSRPLGASRHARHRRTQ